MNKKVVVITGASSGIGKACVVLFLEKNYRVVAAARSDDKLLKLAEECGNSENLMTVVTDVSVEEDCKKLMAKAVDRYGQVDVLINNAGISMRGMFLNTELSVLKKLMDVNFWGTVYCTRYALPEILKQSGSIVGISSIAGKKGLPARTGYSASKFAMEGFLETIRMEHLKDGLHVLVVCPGFTNTDIRKAALGESGLAQEVSPRDETAMMSAEKVALEVFKALKTGRRDRILSFNGKLTVFLKKFFPALTDKLVYRHMAKEAGSPLK